MLICSLGQECALGRNPLTIPVRHTSDTKWPWSIYTGFLSENVKPKGAPQAPAVLQLLRGTRLNPSSTPLNWDPPDNEAQEWGTSPSAALLFRPIFAPALSAIARMDTVELSDLHLEVPWERSTGQACLVTLNRWNPARCARGPAGSARPACASTESGPWTQTAEGKPLGGPFPEQGCVRLPSCDLEREYLFSPVLFFPRPKAFLNSFCKITGEHWCKKQKHTFWHKWVFWKFFGWGLSTVYYFLNGVEWKYFFSCVSGFPHHKKIPGLKKKS